MTEASLTAIRQDLARAYAGGAPGVLVSGLVWSIVGAMLLVAAPALFGIGLPINLGFLVGIVELIAAMPILQRWRARA